MSDSKRIVHAPRGNTGHITVVNDKKAIRPIYPVRYAYANFFTDKLAEATEPPALSELLHAKDIAEGKGYIVRLLRKGWVYIREEDDETNGYFHIFKYTKVEKNGQLIEQFSKYLFKNRINAQDGLEIDKTGRPGNAYPFVFVRRHVTQISIAFSEHEWSADVIDKMNSSSSERDSAMQRVDLMADEDQHAVKATEGNLSKLIEDYRTRKDRLLQIKESDADPDIEDISLDLLTTESSYDLDAENIASALQKRIGRGEVARIVALYDPLGRQKEITEAHAKLSAWEKDYSSLNLYPFVIGQFVTDLKNSSDNDIKEIVQKSINWSEHDKYWNDLKNDLNLFKERQEQFSKLYGEFMFGGSQQGKVGSLDTYFKKFFCRNPSESQDAESELQKLCDVSADLFAGMLASSDARQTLELILVDASDRSDNIDDSTNALHVLFEVFRGIVTTPQTKIDWSVDSVRALDKILQFIGPLWGEAVSLLKYSSEISQRALNKLTFNSLKYVTERIVPATLEVYGLKIDLHNKVTLTHDELAKVVAKFINQQAKGQPSNALDTALKKARQGQRLFDWAERIRQQKLPLLWDLSEVRVMRVSGERYSFVVPKNKIEKVGLIFDSGFAGLSAFFNALTIKDLANQSMYAKANPLNRGSMIHSMLQFTSSIASLTLDTILLSRSAALVSAKALSYSSSSLATALAPRITGQASKLGRFLVGKMATRVIAVANFAAFLSSVWDCINSVRVGNTGEAIGHAMLAVGSGIIFGQAIVSLATAGTATAGATATTVVGIPIAVVITLISLLMMGIGLALLYIYGKTPFQILLENCFWGVSDKYAFWSDLSEERPAIRKRLNLARRIYEDDSIQYYYQMEFQEFMNFLCMPQLDIKVSTRSVSWEGRAVTYRYRFTLPNFKAGISELHFSISTPSTIPFSLVAIPVESPALTQKLYDEIRKAKFTTQNGLCIVDVSIDTPSRLLLKWSYEPTPGVVVPMRLLSESGLRKDIVAGMFNESPK